MDNFFVIFVKDGMGLWDYGVQHALLRR